MGHLYQPTEWYCKTCHRKPRAKNGERQRCLDAGHDLKKRKSSKWVIKRSVNGRQVIEYTGTEKKTKAARKMKLAEGKTAAGEPWNPRAERMTVEDGAKLVLADHEHNNRKSIAVTGRRIDKHILPKLGHRRLAALTGEDIVNYVTTRKAETTIIKKAYDFVGPDGLTYHVPEQRRETAGPSNAEINRELTIIKRIYSLARKHVGLLHRPSIELLEENNVRRGFFDDATVAALLAKLPEDVAAVVEFAYVTGWRVHSEVLPLEWSQVDFRAGEVRLEPGATKNGEGRTCRMTARLRALLDARKAAADEQKKAGRIVPWVFFRIVKRGRGEAATFEPRRIVAFNVAWKRACREAGCPGRIPHDLRRSAVRNFVRRGITDGVAMRMSGHLTRSVFERYNITAESDLRDAAEKLDAYDRTHGLHPDGKTGTDGK